ncbi:MAG: ABC transporter permease [Spirochaetaceae bacterium]|nr:ABC transporter permease [Spirochaetaceae bacterium]
MAKSANTQRHWLVDLLVRMVRTKPLGTACGVVVLALIVVAVFADLLAPYPYDEIYLMEILEPPSARHLLGTDNVGRDFLSRIIHGARVSLLVGLAATTISVVVAVLVGGVTGFLGGKLDLVVQRFVDAWIAFPGLLLLLTLMSVLGRGVLQIILVLGISGGIGSGSRVVRSAVIGIKENVYFEAGDAIGSTTWRMLTRHVLPNIAPPVIIIFSISIGGYILSAASLSFLGFGLPPDVPDWGGMLSREGRTYMEAAPRLALWPGLCLTLVVYSLNMFGDALRDLLDPRLRGSDR